MTEPMYESPTGERYLVDETSEVIMDHFGIRWTKRRALEAASRANAAREWPSYTMRVRHLGGLRYELYATQNVLVPEGKL